MRSEEIAIWSAACGGIAVLALLAFGQAIRLKNWAGWRNFIWLFATFHLVLVLSGLSPYLYSFGSSEDLPSYSVFLGPLWFSLCTFLVRFIDPRLRTGRFVNLAGWATVVAGPALTLLAWLADDPSAVAGAVLPVLLACIFLMTVVAVVAGLNGSIKSYGLALAGMLSVPALTGLYTQAHATSTQAFTALFVVLCTLLVGTLVRPSALHYRLKSKLQPSPGRDPLTQLYNSAGIVRKLLEAQKRQRWIRGSGALLMVNLSGTESLARQYSHLALDVLLVTVAARLQLVAGDSNPVGRYGDDCFVIVLENVQSVQSLESFTAAVRLAMSQPVHFQHAIARAEAILPRFGLGSVHLTPHTHVDTLLFDAQALAATNLHGI